MIPKTPSAQSDTMESINCNTVSLPDSSVNEFQLVTDIGEKKRWEWGRRQGGVGNGVDNREDEVMQNGMFQRGVNNQQALQIRPFHIQRVFSIA